MYVKTAERILQIAIVTMVLLLLKVSCDNIYGHKQYTCVDGYLYETKNKALYIQSNKFGPITCETSNFKIIK